VVIEIHYSIIAGLL